jgi:hypothetical protein
MNEIFHEVGFAGSVPEVWICGGTGAWLGRPRLWVGGVVEQSERVRGSDWLDCSDTHLTLQPLFRKKEVPSTCTSPAYAGATGRPTSC